MSDDANPTIEQLQAELQELRQFRDLYEATRAENAALRSENSSLAAGRSEAVQQQAATQQTMHAIASGPSDAQAVLQAIVEAVARLFETDAVSFFRADGDEFERMANLEAAWWTLPAGQRLPIARESMVGRACFERRTIRHDDLDAILDEEYPITAPSYHARLAAQGPDAKRVRSLLVVPLLREGRAIGALSASRMEVRPFTDAEAALLEA